MIKIDFARDEIFLSSGKRLYANNCILGISEYRDDDGRIVIEVSEGYDGGIDSDSLTPDEKRELADYAVKLWRRWSNAE